KDSEYKRLIEVVENYGLKKQRSLLFHNYGYHQLRRGHYDDACKLYKKALDTKEPDTTGYLGSLDGYLNALTAQQGTPYNELLPLAEEGIYLSKKLQEAVYIHLFHLHKYKLQKKIGDYYIYLET